MVQNLVKNNSNLTISSVYCAENTSFALLQTSKNSCADELYSWGSSQDGILGIGTSANTHSPKKVELKVD